MHWKNSEELWNQFHQIQAQQQREEEIAEEMVELLELEGLTEDELPQNDAFDVSVKRFLKEPAKLYAALQSVDVDHIKVDQFICFKANDVTTGTEDIYFVSPDKVLYLEAGSLVVF
ncbi:hypothetical protein ABFY60_27490 [Lysinibacillus pakistanensis]|uniref:hypothetical protein n=1 Tax=Lysinibacillus pakistanensis TaxID=759811 RepID=UPI003D27BC37